MVSVGIFEARRRLTHLLKVVARGERILITNRGEPVAMLVPPEIEPVADTAKIGQAMLAYRDQVKRSLGGSSRELAHDGHGRG